MPVSPDYMAYGDEIDFDGQIIAWLTEERANLFARLAAFEAENAELKRRIGDNT